MNYLLLSVNKTQSRAIAVRDYIKMAFKISPNDVRYDSDIPSMNTELTSISKDLREITIKERINSFISNIRNSLDKIEIESIKELPNNLYEVSIIVNEEKLKFKL